MITTDNRKDQQYCNYELAPRHISPIPSLETNIYVCNMPGTSMNTLHLQSVYCSQSTSTYLFCRASPPNSCVVIGHKPVENFFEFIWTKLMPGSKISINWENASKNGSFTAYLYIRIRGDISGGYMKFISGRIERREKAEGRGSMRLYKEQNWKTLLLPWGV